ncbi:MAG: Vacuolar-sorting protein SNF7 [Watsoniomyces obsoletus]|nr:MAG: Vacuolar-sorting protein SNF7 [Watsoniomyces obsoletus]
MFRKPRTDTEDHPVKPDVGRPPSPNGSGHAQQESSLAGSRHHVVISTRTPLGGRTRKMGNSGTNGRSPAHLKRTKSKVKPNGSILSFFRKVDPVKHTKDENAAGEATTPGDPDSLFVLGDEEKGVEPPPRLRSKSPNGISNSLSTGQGALGVTAERETRFNEDGRSVKRRRGEATTVDILRQEGYSLVQILSARPDDFAMALEPGPPALAYAAASSGVDLPGDRDCSPSPKELEALDGVARPTVLLEAEAEEFKIKRDGSNGEDMKPPQVIRSNNPFVECSDSEDGDEKTGNGLPVAGDSYSSNPLGTASNGASMDGEPDVEETAGKEDVQESINLKREESQVDPEFNEFDELDFDDEEFGEGEELLERRLAQEQRLLELAENGVDQEDDADDLLASISKSQESRSGMRDEDGAAEACPICNASLSSLSNNDAQLHVNHCLDGTPLPTPRAITKAAEPTTTLNANRFQRPVRQPKPGQASPFTIGSERPTGSSAFSKLMSSHAEDAAWATAAAAENAARGKPAFQRTCPFYKILPGFSICVDAFRYGAVEGCQAYFLSHFHSDHYVGLTSTWAHGPIYCSRITANLVRQQLRVDPKFVIDLEFEKKMEVPGTRGVQVTMISANHCPGSSLYLFEKVVGAGKTPKVQRVLHCGDFRACPAHVRHPLLRPDVLDSSGLKSIAQQKIDVCYLDTTYLNPKYAFPSQEQVINACADMCISLHKDFTDHNDEWEQMKRRRAGNGMTKFIDASLETSIVREEEKDDHVDAMNVNAKAATNKPRGRLLVVVGTYSIGKERICMGIARALDCKIYAPPGKQRICACLEDSELNSRLTSDPYEAQVHMTPLFEIRAETLQDYLNVYKPHFSRVVGFRPSGWNYRPPNSRFVESPAVQTVLGSPNWKSTYSMAELTPQRGSTREASCFGVPYSEHSSFRELTMFCCALRIDKIIPTVNVGSAKSREKMKSWFEKWAAEKKKNGLYKIPEIEGGNRKDDW